MLLRDPPTPITAYRSDLPAGLEAIIVKCLAREPDDRFQNVSALADALLPYASITSRVHAERARRVLLNSTQDVSLSAFRNSVDSVPDTAVSGPPVTSGGSRNEPVPLTLTNAKTQASPGLTPPTRRRRTVVWVALGLCVVAVAGVKALGWMDAPVSSDPAASVADAQPAAAAPAAEPLAPLPTAAPVVTAEPAPEPPAPPSSAEAPMPPPTGVPDAPVAPLKPPVQAAVPRPQLNWAKVARPTAAAAKPAPAPAAPAPAPAKPSGVSDFGGRK
jgi:hypothetical protein